MAVNVSQAVYQQIVALRDGSLNQAATERGQATTLNEQAAAHEQAAADYTAMLADLTVASA